jgi:hypothetical protein
MGNVPKKVPTPVMVIAILHFCFGGLGLLCVLAQGAAIMTTFQSGGGSKEERFQAELKKGIDERRPENDSLTTGILVFGLISSLTLILLGIGLLSMQSWARIGSILWATVDLIVSLAHAVYCLVLVLPVAQDVLQTLKARYQELGQMAQITELAMTAGTYLNFCSVLYPSAVLIVMLMPSVGRAFRPQIREGNGAFPPQEPEDDYPPRYPQGDGGYRPQ